MIHNVDWRIDAAERRAAIAAEIKMMRGPGKVRPIDYAEQARRQNAQAFNDAMNQQNLGGPQFYASGLANMMGNLFGTVR